MAVKQKYNNVLVSGRKDGTLTYSKYVKDPITGVSVKDALDVLKELVKAATGIPQDLLDRMLESDKNIQQMKDKLANIKEITADDIQSIIAGTYVPDSENEQMPEPENDFIGYVRNINKKVYDTSDKLDSFIDSKLTAEQVNDLLDKEQ